MTRRICALSLAALAAGVLAPAAARGASSRDPGAASLVTALKRMGMYAGAPRVVRDADGLAAALGSNRTILLEPGVYDVTKRGGAISGLENLTLAAASPGTVRLVSRDAYGDVLVVSGARNVSLVNLVVGHLDAPACTGGALVIRDSRRVRVRGCRLFGSGSVGVAATRVQGLRLEDVEIDDCHGHIATVTDSGSVVFEGGDLHQNEASLQIRSSSVTFRGTRIRDNRHWSGDPLLVVDAVADGLHASAVSGGGGPPSTVVFERAVLGGNRFPALANGKGALELADTALDGNLFDGPHRWVVASIANLRSAPDASGALLRRVPIGTRVVVLQDREGWSRVAVDGAAGFLPSPLLVGEPPTVPGMLAALEKATSPAERRAWAERAAALAPRSAPVLEKLVAALEDAGDPAAAAQVRAAIEQLRGATPAPAPDGDGILGRQLLPCGVGGPVELRASPGGAAGEDIVACENAYAGLDGTNIRRFAVRSRREGWLELAEVAAGGDARRQLVGWIPAAELRGAYAITDGKVEVLVGLHRPRIEKVLPDRVILRGESVPCSGEELTEEVPLPEAFRVDRLRVIQRVAYDPDSDCST